MFLRMRIFRFRDPVRRRKLLVLCWLLRVGRLAMLVNRLSWLLVEETRERYFYLVLSEFGVFRTVGLGYSGT